MIVLNLIWIEEIGAEERMCEWVGPRVVNVVRAWVECTKDTGLKDRM